MPLNAPVAADTPETFTDVINLIEAMDSLSKSRRRDLISALKSMARFFGKQPNEVPANTNWLRQRLRQFHPRQVGVSEKYLANIKSAVVAALKMTGANSTRTACQPAMSGQFATLYDAVPDKLLAYKLSRFFRWCSEQGLAPGEIGDDTVEAFEAAVTKETLHRNPSKVARDAVLTWNKMRDCVAGWPDIVLTRASSRVPWTIPLDKFPATFQADVDAWCRRMAVTDLFDENSPVRASRPATIKHRRFQIRMMASAIVLSGVDISKVAGLRDIVEVENFRLGIKFMIERGDGKITEAIFGLASGIKAIGRHYVKADDAHLERMNRLCSRLDQQADRYRKKNMERLAQFDDRRNLALLMRLPERLRALSMQLGPKPRSAALYMQSAVAIEILIMCPMRIGNLVNLDIDRHLKWIKDKGKRRLVITIPGDEVKNGTPLRYELEGPSAELVSEYMERARLELCSQPSTALFPRVNGGPRNPGDLSQQIKRHFFEQTGLVVNAHLFRSLAGKIHNLVNAGDAATISHVLGDRIGTVMKSYTQFEQKAALDHYQSSVNSVRGADMMGSA